MTITQLDHLVMAAHTLEQGVAWCEAVLGATPAAGGKHVGMGTHNRLLSIGSVAFPQAYLEIIAIDPEAPPPGRRAGSAWTMRRCRPHCANSRDCCTWWRGARNSTPRSPPWPRWVPMPAGRWRPSVPARTACCAGASQGAPTANCCTAAPCRR